MAAIFAHMQLVKDLTKENPKIFTKSDVKYLVQGATFPDIYYITGLRSLIKKPNISKFIHETVDEDYSFGKLLLEKAKNRKERLFALGFISHFILDKHVHDYINSHGLGKSIKHLMSEYYLDTKFKNQKVPTPRFPIKLIRNCLKEYYPKEYSAYSKRLKLSINSVLFYLFANKMIIKKIVNGRYRKEKYKKRLSLIDIPFKLARLSKYQKFGYDYKLLLNPDISVKIEHTENMYKEYLIAKKETFNIIIDYELGVSDYTTKQTKIIDFEKLNPKNLLKR
jgi:hypothetical protein